MLGGLYEGSVKVKEVFGTVIQKSDEALVMSVFKFWHMRILLGKANIRLSLRGGEFLLRKNSPMWRGNPKFCSVILKIISERKLYFSFNFDQK